VFISIASSIIIFKKKHVYILPLLIMITSSLLFESPEREHSKNQLIRSIQGNYIHFHLVCPWDKDTSTHDYTGTGPGCRFVKYFNDPTFCPQCKNKISPPVRHACSKTGRLSAQPSCCRGCGGRGVGVAAAGRAEAWACSGRGAAICGVSAVQVICRNVRINPGETIVLVHFGPCALKSGM
jgi:hypothetical protein